MIEIASEADIRGSAEQVFDVIADFRGQGRWLASSSVFQGTHDVTSNPATVGTTYREPGRVGVRNGTVTECERPTKLTCHQPLTMKLRAGVIDVTMTYTLIPGADSTHVTRVVHLGVPWAMKPLQPVLVRAFRAESGRTLEALKAYVEAQT